MWARRSLLANSWLEHRVICHEGSSEPAPFKVLVRRALIAELTKEAIETTMVGLLGRLRVRAFDTSKESGAESTFLSFPT